MSLADIIKNTFKNNKTFKLEDAYNAVPDKPHTTIRGRIYDNIGIKFERIEKGVYKVIQEDNACVVVEGDGRDLSFLEDNYIDCIITDHPWDDTDANKGGNRNMADYKCFEYTQEDFDEKYRVLKPGAFLIEVLPYEKATNYKYLYSIKIMAEKAGFLYFAKVPWKKLKFVSNMGRNSKNIEDIMIFSKGKPRALRYDAQRTKLKGHTCYMSGAKRMLPTHFPARAIKGKINVEVEKSEKPVKLWEQILDLFTLEHEIILDQFAGSGSVGQACLNTNRNCILIELMHDKIERMCDRLQNNKYKFSGQLNFLT